MQGPGTLKRIAAANICFVRSSRGLSRRALAEAIGVDAMLVYKWERGLHLPNQRNLAALARFGDVHEAWFLTDHDHPAPSPMVRPVAR